MCWWPNEERTPPDRSADWFRSVLSPSVQYLMGCTPLYCMHGVKTGAVCCSYDSRCNQVQTAKPVPVPSQCLILSERLQAVGRAFDHMRSQRAMQLARQQQRRTSRTQPVRGTELTLRGMTPHR